MLRTNATVPIKMLQWRGNMIYNTKNPVALKSQKWLVDTLLALMTEKPYRDIKIKDITNKAQVDRSTFYRNFSSKEDILNLHVRQLAETYVKRLKTHKTLTMETVAQILITLCFENIQFFTLLRKESLSYFVLNHFNEKL